MNNFQPEEPVEVPQYSSKTKANWADPAYKAAAIERLNAARNKSNHREKVREAMKARWADPSFRSKIVEGLRKPRPDLSKAQKDKWTDPAYKAEKIEKLQRAKIASGAHVKISEKLKVKWTNTSYRENMIAGFKDRYSSTEYQDWVISERTRTGRNFAIYPKNREEHPSALHVVLRSPDNRTFKVDNLLKFVRENAALFNPDSMTLGSKGLPKAYNNLLQLFKKKNPNGSSMGWTLVSKTEVFYNEGEDLLSRAQTEVVI